MLRSEVQSVDEIPSLTSWITEGGEMGDLIRAFDWAQTPIGSAETWSPTLRTMVRFLLVNRLPLLLWWGPQYISLHNDACRPVLGAKHSEALGKPGSESWGEMWRILKPLIDTPLHGGPATCNDDIELELNRNGFLEEAHFTIAYSAVPDEAAANGIGGVFATMAEITDKVVGERRILILRDLASRAGEARPPAEACAIAAETLAKHSKDVPFALLYLFDADRGQARLAGATGVGRGEAISPELISFKDKHDDQGWPLGSAEALIDDLPSRFPAMSWESLSDLSRQAVALPIAALNAAEPIAFLVVGLNPRLNFDSRYRDFLQLMKAQIGSAIANAQFSEEQRKRSTGRKRAEDTQKLLLVELSHRVKNMLASVHAIARLTLRNASDPAAFVESFTGRLQSMARMHSLLTNSGWDGADLRDTILDQILPGAADDKRVVVSGPSVRLEAQTAQHTGMVLHELGTNSVKYGALSRSDGQVSIEWTVRGDSLVLDWRERGGPRIAEPLKRGFGTNLIEQTVKGQGGSARRSVEAEGIYWEITFPLASADDGDALTDAAEGQPSRSPVTAPASLKGRKLAVIEDDPLIAFNIASTLEHCGAQVFGPVATVAEALRLIEDSELDGALVDANLRGKPVSEVAAALTRKGIPFAFVTGYDREALPASFAGASLLKKPFTDEQLLDATALLIEQPQTVLRLRD
jgi:two-component sensor histidine kinase/CheY-like chemotaxis protein